MKFLVTGGTGFLGSALVARLAELGHRVRVLVRRTSDVSSLPPSAELAYGDVTARESLTAAADGCDCIIHMAALVQAWARDPSQFEKVNVGGLENVLHALRTLPSVRTVIYTSSFFALGPTDGRVADGTQSHPASGFCSEYERTKYVADQVAVRAATEEGLNLLLVYPGVIYGPGRVSTSNLLAKMIVDQFHGRLPGYIGDGTKLSCFVHVNDVVTGILGCLEGGKPGRRYILGGENVSIRGVFKIVQDITGRAPPSLQIPIWVAKIIGYISVAVAYLGGPVPIFTNKSVEAFTHDWAYSSGLARQDFGYTPLSLREGLEETLQWLKGTGYITY